MLDYCHHRANPATPLNPYQHLHHHPVPSSSKMFQAAWWVFTHGACGKKRIVLYLFHMFHAALWRPWKVSSPEPARWTRSEEVLLPVKLSQVESRCHSCSQLVSSSNDSNDSSSDSNFACSSFKFFKLTTLSWGKFESPRCGFNKLGYYHF